MTIFSLIIRQRKANETIFLAVFLFHPEFYAVFRKDQAHLSAAFFALTFADRSGTYPRIS